MDLPKRKDVEIFHKYKEGKKEAKRTISKARSTYLYEVYRKLGTRKGENDIYIYIYKLARIRERKCQDLNQVRCVKDNTYQILTKDKDIRKRCKSYFEKLYNDDHAIEFDNLRSQRT